MDENFSNQLKVSCCRILPVIMLTVKEREIVENAVDKYCYEFSAGRRCARKCLEHSGITGFSLLKGKYGEPVWPRGFTGSITHSSGVAIAVVASEAQGFIGIDLVDLSEQIPDPRLILCNMESNIRFANNLKNPELLLFSLNESVIKILSQALQEYIEFKDITIIPGKGVAKIAYREEEVGINLFWFIHGNHAFTVALKTIVEQI